MRTPHIQVVVDLDRVRSSAEEIRRATGVPVIAVIKADAYGLGAARVADALAAVVDDFAYFSVHEARDVGRPGLVIGPPEAAAAEFRELKLRPTVGRREDARRLAGMRVAVALDTGMQRFGCDPQALDDLLRACDADEIHTHTSELAGVELLRQHAGGRGLRLLAACSSLIGEPRAWLDGVRPGVALYRGAMRVSAPLHTVRATRGPIGYTGFQAPHVGIILGGYSNLLAPAPVLINGRPQRLLEIGMNTSYVSIDPSDRPGDEVVLLGDGLTEAHLARHFNVREHEILCRFGCMGARRYAAISTEARHCPQTPRAAEVV